MSGYRASILLAARDGASDLLRCLSAVARLGDGAGFEVVVVDDGSTDETAALLASVDGDLRALRTGPDSTGWGPAIDRAAAAATGEHLVLLREDAVPVDGWFDALLAALDAADAARPVTARPDGSRLDGDRWACLAVRREAFRAVGGVTGASRPGRAERATFLRALRAGGRAVADARDAVVLVGT